MKNKSLQLQPRLQMLADLVPPGARLADIGTDHGYLPVWLLSQGKISSAVAADIAADPLDHARRTAEEYGVHENLAFRLCDGLQGLSLQDADTLVIAGMGGETIVHILSQADWCREAKLLLLQPMTKSELLRSWLTENGYTIQQERLVRDKAYLYPILLVAGGNCAPLTAAEVYCGVNNQSDPLFPEYLQQRLQRLDKIMEGLSNSREADVQGRVEGLRQLRQELMEREGVQR